MSLVRKKSLEQLLDIQKMMNAIGDLGEKTTKKVKDFYDYTKDTDVATQDALYDMSNEIQHSGKNPDLNNITRFGQGNLGECSGDLTEQEYANNYFQHNPLDKSNIDTIEEFDLQYWFNGSTWGKNLTPKGQLHRVQESYNYYNKTKYDSEKNYKTYYLNKPDYDYIIVLDINNKLKGFATRGYQTTEMKKNNINTIGTIWGPGVGDLLYNGMIEKFGPIIPSKNISDQAKVNWIRKIKKSDYNNYLKKNIGFYSVYKEEQILNTILDLKSYKKNKCIILDAENLENLDILSNEVKQKHDYMTKVFIKNKELNYTFGESNDRYEWLDQKNKQDQKIISKIFIKDSKEFFNYYNIPFFINDNKYIKQYLSFTL